HSCSSTLAYFHTTTYVVWVAVLAGRRQATAVYRNRNSCKQMESKARSRAAETADWAEKGVQNDVKVVPFSLFGVDV
ncbi:hypothetical protein GE09DRAFT_1128573, partial [Coniochaeta sp. 2T2.1]